MKRVIPSTVLGLASLLALDVQAQSPDLQARVRAASCAACHGTNEHSQGVFLSIGGVDKAQLLQKLTPPTSRRTWKAPVHPVESTCRLTPMS